MTFLSPSLQPAVGSPVDLETRNRAHRAAKQHSVRVKQLRRALPILTVLIGIGFFATMLLDSRMALTSQGSVDDLGVAGASITMENPKLTGFSKSSRPYEILATRAEQSLQEPNRVTLSELDAKIETGSSGMTRLTAPRGRFETQKQQLFLDENVTIRSDKGDMADLRNAEVDLEAGNIVTRLPVRIKIGQTQLSADTMQVLKNGDQIIFDGKVRMTMHPRQDEPIAEPPSDMLHIAPNNGTGTPVPADATIPEGTPE